MPHCREHDGRPVRERRHLTQLLGRRVDLATPDALHKTLRASILGEAIRADLTCPCEGDDSEDAEVIDDQVERVAGAVSGIIIEW